MDGGTFSITTSFLDHSIFGIGRPVISAGMLTGSPALTLMVSPLTAKRRVTVGGTVKERLTQWLVAKHFNYL